MYTFRLQAYRPYYGSVEWGPRDIGWLCERLYPAVKVRISIDRTYYHRAYDDPSWHDRVLEYERNKDAGIEL